MLSESSCLLCVLRKRESQKFIKFFEKSDTKAGSIIDIDCYLWLCCWIIIITRANKSSVNFVVFFVFRFIGIHFFRFLCIFVYSFSFDCVCVYLISAFHHFKTPTPTIYMSFFTFSLTLLSAP